MQFPESWLREFCNPPLDTRQLADLLTMAGMEVEHVAPVAPPFSGVVVGRIVAAEPHPEADRLQVCRVDIGGGEPLQVVCGAPNARVGLAAPLATVGAWLPPAADGQGVAIGIGNLRGVKSHGMLCSAKELKIADDHAGLLELPADAPVGADLRNYLQLDDTVFTLKLTPNLAHCLSVFGVAREVSALTGAPLVQATIVPVLSLIDDRLPVDVQAPDLCGRFSGRIVRNLDPRSPTPRWMVQRLARCGQRSVSALVDISNYVMFELGRPSHIFDLDKIDGGLVVRWGAEGESLQLLNGSTVTVDATVGVIADASRVESLAGIMGGQGTAVSDDTRNVYVEAAFWWPDAVAGRSRRYAFSTDAGHRFERGVDPALTVAHIERITQLVVDICGGTATACGPVDDRVLRLPPATPVQLRVARAARIIGLPVTQQQCADVFGRLGLQFSEAPGVITVVPPSWRFDLKIEEDLVEEVIRVIGYDKLPAVPPVAPVTARVRSEGRRGASAVQRALAGMGYQETISFSFVEERWERELAGNDDPLRVLNPISAPLAVMRSSLLGSLLSVLRYNLARRATQLRIFELGRVFQRDGAAKAGPLAVAGVQQPVHVAGLVYGAVEPLQWSWKERSVDYFDVKGDVESLLSPLRPVFFAAAHPAMHPGRCARIELHGSAVGYVGELHPKWRQAYELPLAPVLFELNLEAVSLRPMPGIRPLPRQQTVSRDIALVVRDDVLHDALITEVSVDPLVQSATLFDVYKPSAPIPGVGAHERSLAVRLELLDPHATLTEDRIDAVVTAVVARVLAAFSGRMRG